MVNPNNGESSKSLAEDYGIELIDSSEKIQKKNDAEIKYKSLPFEEKIKTFRFWKKILIVFVWLVALKLIEKHTGFGSVFIALSIFALILMNLDSRERKPGEMSAYSIFNEGGARILGDNREQLLAGFGIGRQGFNEDNNREQITKRSNQQQAELSIPKDNKEWMKQISKMGNKPCYCGSERKYKKCCYYREIRHQQEKSDAMKRKIDAEYYEVDPQNEDED